MEYNEEELLEYNKEYLKKYLNEEDLETGIKRLEQGEPVQYIVGNVNFYGYLLNVDKRVLIPRFETEELVEKTVKYIHQYFSGDISIIDLGTGSGCIAITLKKLLPYANVMAIDNSYDALEVAKMNAFHNDTKILFKQNDMLHGIEETFDVIISNPPYIAHDEEIMDIVKNNEPHNALYANNNGLYFYEDILKECSKNLKEKFLIAFEIGEKQGEDIQNLAYQYLENIEVSIEKDLRGLTRFVFIRKI